ncbi:MAG: GNAT family N-acetyltransferase [Deltaproteobacteria bacterium]|nr:GNAT family N-acetyltransferase [Deltaproteobacteria bacterium]
MELAVDIREMTKADFDQVVEVIDQWWGGPVAQQAHPAFFHEFGDTALVAVEDGELAGFVLGFIAPTAPPVAYVHLVGVRPDLQRKGLGQTLYERFAATCRARGVRQIKAITTLANEGSRKFHLALGFEERVDGDYAGRGRARVIFVKRLD